MIAIQPDGGLANRMRALDSAICLARKTNKTTILLWRLDSSLNCKFHRLFKRPKNVWVLNYKNSYATILFRRILAFQWWRYFYNLPQTEVQKFIGYGKVLENLALMKNLHIQTCGRFYISGKPFDNFKPSNAMNSKIRSVFVKFSKRTIGVHIRRGDNTLSIVHSPIGEFILLMKNELKAFPETKFFVATDAPIEEEKLKKLFFDKIIVHNKIPTNRNSPISIEDGLIDLYCLSKCIKIIGSYYSSFSEIAAQIGSIELSVVNTDSK